MRDTGENERRVTCVLLRSGEACVGVLEAIMKQDVLTAATVKTRVTTAVRHLLTKAITEWAQKNDNARAIISGNEDDFNFGDFVEQIGGGYDMQFAGPNSMPDEDDLEKYLYENGFIAIECSAYLATEIDDISWDFDDKLYHEENI